jgi:molybdopterin molybdotransferase
VTTGGVSVGAHDHVGAALATTFELVVWRLAIQPGKPLLLGRRRAGGDGALWAIGLPGNPVSAFVVGVEVAFPPSGARWTTGTRATSRWSARGARRESAREALLPSSRCTP